MSDATSYLYQENGPEPITEVWAELNEIKPAAQIVEDLVRDAGLR